MRVGIGLPAYGGTVCAWQGITWLTLGARLGAHPNISLAMFLPVDICGVDRARNHLLKIARDSNLDWLLMMDSDVWVEGKGDLLKMIHDAEMRKASVVGPSVIMRGAKQVPMVYKFEEKASQEIIGQKTVEGKLFEPKAGEVTEVDAIGGSCMAIHLKRTEGCYFAFTGNVSEDLEFCRQVREKGGKVLVDGRIRTCHLDRQTSIILVWEGA